MLIHNYELFSMKQKEPIQDMLTHFSNITSELKFLGKIINIEEQVRKVIRSLPHDEKWMAKVTTLLDTKDSTRTGTNFERLKIGYPLVRVIGVDRVIFP